MNDAFRRLKRTPLSGNRKTLVEFRELVSRPEELVIVGGCFCREVLLTGPFCMT